MKLNKEYSAREVAEDILHIKYETFRSHKQKYLNDLSEYYEGKQEGRKYIFTKEIKPYKTKQEESKFQKNYNEIYYPAVIAALGEEGGNTITGITVEILPDINIDHAFTTSRHYVGKVVGDNYMVDERRYRACYASGVYGDFLTEEEMAAGKEMRGNWPAIVTKQMSELVEDYYVYHRISTEDFQEGMNRLAVSGYLSVLEEGYNEHGFIPVLNNHYVSNEIGYSGTNPKKGEFEGND